MVTVQTDAVELPRGRHDIEIAFETRPFGRVRFKVQDASARIKTAGRGFRVTSGTTTRLGSSASGRRSWRKPRREAAAPGAVFLRPTPGQGQLREFHGRGAGAGGLRRAAANRRRARARRFSNSAGHIRGHAGGLIQSRHEGAECVRRREGDGGGRCHAARARLRVSRRTGGPRFRALDGRQPGTNPPRDRIWWGGPHLQPATGFWTTMPGLRTSIWNPISPRTRRDPK